MSQAQGIQHCLICSSPATVRRDMLYSRVDCRRCGDFQVERIAIDDVPLPLKDAKAVALASYLVCKLQTGKRPSLSQQFFDSLQDRTLPTPAELADNLLLFEAKQSNGRPGAPLSISHSDLSLASAVGAFNEDDLLWAVRELEAEGFIKGSWLSHFANGHITGRGWRRVEELKRTDVSSRFAFFARKFANSDLDHVYEKCLKLAVKQTGFELRTVTQRAGHIDAVIEDEIRRCRFLLADLSDGNAGAYWEAGFAEGLSKPVIYICQDNVKTHFDTDHRHTVRWSLENLDETARQLKAVIRNTLLGDANQQD